MSRFVHLEFNQPPERKGGSLRGGLPAPDASACLTRAQEAFDQAEFEEAFRFFARGLEFDSKSVAAWNGQVQTLIEMERFEEANRWADQAVERLPQVPELLAAKAVATGRLGDLAGAIAFSDASVEADQGGRIPAVWIARGDVLLARREGTTDFCFSKALDLAPQDWRLGWWITRVRQHYGQFALALQMAQQALEWDPGRFVLWLQVGWCRQALGLVVPAREAFEQACQLNPHCAAARNGLVTLREAGWGSRLTGWWRRKVQRGGSRGPAVQQKP